MKCAVHRPAVLHAAEDATFGCIASGQVDHLAVLIVERPNVAVRSDDDTLHLAQLATEVVAGPG